MQVVYEAESIFDAQLLKDAIEAEGIPAFIIGAALAGGIGELPAMGLVRVAVPDGAVPTLSCCLPGILRDLDLPDVQSSSSPTQGGQGLAGNGGILPEGA